MSLWNRPFPAPGKLNLFLHVVGRRPDGYHLLQTLFRLIDCCDWLTYEPRTDGRITLGRPLAGVAESGELSVRAAMLLAHEAGMREGVTITIDKHIPVGGGLGGGSSDAATTLLVLDRAWGLGLGRQRLAALARRLGADVPFFLTGENAFAEGVGDELTPIALPQAWYVVLVPPLSVSTASVFSDRELTRNTNRIKISSFSTGFGRNDLEPVVRRRHGEIAAHLDWLKRFGDARLTGSGACVFAEFGTEREAREVLSGMPSGMRGFAARGFERHPLAALLEPMRN